MTDKLIVDACQDYADREWDGDPYSASMLECFEAGAKWEASRHNSKAESLWQVLNALKIVIQTDHILIQNIAPQVLSLVDQCLLENRPETLVP